MITMPKLFYRKTSQPWALRLMIFFASWTFGLAASASDTSLVPAEDSPDSAAVSSVSLASAAPSLESPLPEHFQSPTEDAFTALESQAERNAAQQPSLDHFQSPSEDAFTAVTRQAERDAAKSSSSDLSQASPDDNTLPTAAIAGIAVGGAVALALFVAAFVKWLRYLAEQDGKNQAKNIIRSPAVQIITNFSQDDLGKIEEELKLRADDEGKKEANTYIESFRKKVAEIEALKKSGDSDKTAEISQKHQEVAQVYVMLAKNLNTIFLTPSPVELTTDIRDLLDAINSNVEMVKKELLPKDVSARRQLEIRVRQGFVVREGSAEQVAAANPRERLPHRPTSAARGREQDDSDGAESVASDSSESSSESSGSHESGDSVSHSSESRGSRSRSFSDKVRRLFVGEAFKHPTSSKLVSKYP